MEIRKLIRGRQKARKILIQALYQWQLNRSPVTDIQAQYLSRQPASTFDTDYFGQLLQGIIQDCHELDAHITEFLDRPMGQLNPIELAILRLSTYELLHCLDIPFRVIIDEAIALSKTYGAVESHRYVNGILHQLANQFRSTEVTQYRQEKNK